MQNPNHHHQPPQAVASLSGRQQAAEIADPTSSEKWASKLLQECATAISDKDSGKIHHLLWMLNELSSPYGDCDQKLAAHFLQALFCKATDSGDRCYRTLLSVADKNHSFDSARKVILKSQEVSPWTTFGHVAANAAILEALDGHAKLHIVDVSNTYCTQWPTLLESLATRNDDTPHLRLTVVVTAAVGAGPVIKEIAHRMEKFARLMGVPFEFQLVSGLDRLGDLTQEVLGLKEDEAVAVNLVGALRRVSVKERDNFIKMVRSLRPRVVTVVEEEADFTSGGFAERFEECLRFYGVVFEMMEESFAATSNERLALERECSRGMLSVLACEEEGEGECERREKGRQWGARMREAGFSAADFSDDALDDVKALLKRYKAGWSSAPTAPAKEGEASGSGLYLTWKEEPVVWVSAWKP